MSITNEAGIGHFHARPVEMQLARSLDEGFDITRGEERNGFSYWCAKPNEQVCNRFDLDREVLCIYYPYPKVDARVFGYIRQVLTDRKLRDRLDQVLVLLVHEADSDQTAEFVRGHEEWVIIPLSKRGLLNSQRGPLYIRGKLAKFAGSHNLFSFSAPVKKDAYFFGRDALVHELYKRATAEGESSGVFGLRKTGKTSVLYALRRRAADTQSVLVYIDCQTPGVHALRWWELLAEVCARFDAELESRHTDDRPQLPRITGERDAALRFGEYIRSVLRRCNCESLTFMFDEIENIMPGAANRLSSHWNQDAVLFWQTVRGVSQETEGKFTFILAGVNPAAVSEPLMSAQVNPIFQLVKPYYLEPLNVPQLRAMIRAIGKYSGTAVDEPVYSTLYGRYGGHPFLVRLACGVVWEKLDTRDPMTRPVLSVTALDAAMLAIRTRLEEPIRDILLSLALWYPQEYELLCILAQGDTEFVLEYALQEPTRFLQFGEFGLIDPETGQFLIPDVREFLATSGELYKSQVQAIARSDVPPELLPESPDLELIKDLHDMQVEIETQLRKIILSVLLVAKKWQTSEVVSALVRGMSKSSKWKDPKAQFIGREPRDVVGDLYMSDLAAIVTENWTDFSGLFGSDRARFEQMAKLANIARQVPSHIKVVTPDEAQTFRAASGWLRTQLRKADSMLAVD